MTHTLFSLDLSLNQIQEKQNVKKHCKSCVLLFPIDFIHTH